MRLMTTPPPLICHLSLIIFSGKMSLVRAKGAPPSAAEPDFSRATMKVYDASHDPAASLCGKENLRQQTARADGLCQLHPHEHPLTYLR